MQNGTQMQNSPSDIETALRNDEILHDLPLSQLWQHNTSPLNLFVRCQYATIAGLPETAVTATDQASLQQATNGMLVVIVRTHKMKHLNMADSVVDVKQVTKNGKVFGDEFSVRGNMLLARGMAHEHFLISLFLKIYLNRDDDCPKNCHFFHETLELERLHFELHAMEHIKDVQATVPLTISLSIDLQTKAAHVLRLANKYHSLVSVGFALSDATRAMFYDNMSFFITTRAVS